MAGKKASTKSDKVVAKITPQVAATQANAAIKILTYLEDNAGYKQKTVRYCKVLLSQWAQSLLIKDVSKKALAELKAKQKKELAEATQKLAEDAKAKLEQSS